MDTVKKGQLRLINNNINWHLPGGKLVLVLGPTTTPFLAEERNGVEWWDVLYGGKVQVVLKEVIAGGTLVEEL